MASDGASATPTQQTIEQTSIPSYAKPYVEEMLGAARANVFETDDKGNILGFQPYQTYGSERMAQFTPLQLQAFESAQALGPSDQGTAASHIAQQAGLAGLQAGSTPYMAGVFTPERVQARGFTAPTGAAQYFAQNPDVGQAYKQNAMGMTPEQFAQTHYERYGMAEGRDPYVATGAEQYFTRNPDVAQAYRENPMGMSPDQYAQLHYERYGMKEGREPYSTGVAQQYMSPYMQNVVNIQQREAQRQADIAGQRQQAEAVRAGAFGGGRDAIMRAEAARNLALQKGDIQAQGLQSAYQQAQAQFNADQARRMQAAMANQQVGLEAQRLGEQSRQYGAGFGLQGLSTALQSAGTLGQLGQTQFGQELGALQQQAALGQQQQQQVQGLLQQQYQDFLNQQRYPYQQLGFMSDMLRGLPMAQTTSSFYQAPPSPIAQVAGLGTAIGGASGLAGVFRAKGGPVHSSRAGLADLMVSQI